MWKQWTIKKSVDYTKRKRKLSEWNSSAQMHGTTSSWNRQPLKNKITFTGCKRSFQQERASVSPYLNMQKRFGDHAALSVIWRTWKLFHLLKSVRSIVFGCSSAAPLKFICLTRRKYNLFQLNHLYVSPLTFLVGYTSETASPAVRQGDFWTTLEKWVAYSLDINSIKQQSLVCSKLL